MRPTGARAALAVSGAAGSSTSRRCALDTAPAARSLRTGKEGLETRRDDILDVISHRPRPGAAHLARSSCPVGTLALVSRSAAARSCGGPRAACSCGANSRRMGGMQLVRDTRSAVCGKNFLALSRGIVERGRDSSAHQRGRRNERRHVDADARTLQQLAPKLLHLTPAPHTPSSS